MSGRQWVAVIDDDDSLRRSIIRLLKSVGIDAHGFSSAEDFLDRPEGPEPSCAVVDLYLGHGMNGYELKERLDADKSTLPIIFMTAQVELPVRMMADQEAMSSIMRKPFRKEELLARLTPMIDILREAYAPAVTEGR